MYFCKIKVTFCNKGSLQHMVNNVVVENSNQQQKNIIKII